MRRMQTKDALRNITKNFISFLAISIVTMIGCGVFFSILFYEDSMTEASGDFFEKTAFEDIDIIVPGGINEEDIARLAETEGVSDAEGSYKLDGLLSVNENRKVSAEIYMLNGRVSVPMVTEGVLPAKADECAMAGDAMDRYGIEIGDIIEIGSVENVPPGFVKNSEYTVTARVQHPTGFRKNAYVLIFLPKEAFETRMIRELYTYVNVVADIPDDIGLLKDEYFEAVRPVKDRIKEKLSDMSYNGVLLITRSEMDGYEMLRTNMTILRMLATVFVILFFLIGAIVLFSTITIIISGQKELIGGMKAIGFRNSEIAARYIMFGAGAVAFGMLLSIIQEMLLQVVIFHELGSMFIIGPEKMTFQPVVFIVLALLEIVMACVVAAFVTIRSALKVSAVDLMNGNTGMKISSGVASSHMGNLYSRLILRNMRTDLARVIVSITVITGSTLMIGTGFTLHGSLNDMMSRSAAEIDHYDIEVSGSRDMGALSDLEDELKEKGLEYRKVEITPTFYRYGDIESHASVISGEVDIFPDYIGLTDMKRKTSYIPNGSGVFVGNRIAEKSGISAGDEIVIYDSDFSAHVLKVEGIIRYYYGAPLVVSPETYKEIFGREPDGNTLMIRTGDEDKDTLAGEFEDNYSRLSFSMTDEMPEEFTGLTRMFTVLVLIMTGLSVMMSVFVLLNLVNIFVHRRQNELVVMRVNGFSYREGIGYLLMETVTTTITGIVLGILVGCAVTEFMVRTVEGGDAMFVRYINPVAWLFAFLLEGSFALIINFIAFRKVKDLKLTDISK